MDPPWLTRHKGRPAVLVQVVPGASRNRVVGPLGDRLKVTVAAPAESGRANEAVLALLAGWLKCARSDLTIALGQAGRRKTITLPDHIRPPTM